MNKMNMDMNKMGIAVSLEFEKKKTVLRGSKINI